MTPAISFQLWREQERLERLGWEFLVSWSTVLQEWDVTARQLPSGPTRSMYASTRQELLQTALQWAAEQQAAAELEEESGRDTWPAPEPERASGMGAL